MNLHGSTENGVLESIMLRQSIRDACQTFVQRYTSFQQQLISR